MTPRAPLQIITTPGSCDCQGVEKTKLLWRRLPGRCMCAAMVIGPILYVVLDPTRKAEAYRQAGEMLADVCDPRMVRLLAVDSRG